MPGVLAGAVIVVVDVMMMLVGISEGNVEGKGKGYGSFCKGFMREGYGEWN